MSRQERRRLVRLVRETARTNRQVRKAQKRVATGTPQAARTWLIASGISPATAKRFAGAFSRSVTPVAKVQTKIKLKSCSRKTRLVTVKLYDRRTFEARLKVYRPSDKVAASEFALAA